MAWSTPRTWNSGETVTASLMNAHLRDQLNVLKTNIDDDGDLKTMFAATVGAGNVSTGETVIFSFSVPANKLPANGDGFRLTMGGALAQNTNTKTIRLKLGGQTLVLLSNAASIASNRFFLDLTLMRDGSASCRVSGFLSHGAGQGATPTLLHWGGNSLATMSPNWASAVTIEITGQGGATNDIVATDCRAVLEKL